MSSKDNTDNADIPDIDIPTWFELHRLPHNDGIVTKLQMIGKDLGVEDLKLFKTHHIEALLMVMQCCQSWRGQSLSLSNY